eukprot:Gb_07144 [translate_table: standard]
MTSSGVFCSVTVGDQWFSRLVCAHSWERHLAIIIVQGGVLTVVSEHRFCYYGWWEGWIQSIRILGNRSNSDQESNVQDVLEENQKPVNDAFQGVGWALFSSMSLGAPSQMTRREMKNESFGNPVVPQSGAVMRRENQDYHESNNAQEDQGANYKMSSKADVASWANGPSPIWSLYCDSCYAKAPYMNGIGGGVLIPEAVQIDAMMPWFQPGVGLCPVPPLFFSFWFNVWTSQLGSCMGHAIESIPSKKSSVKEYFGSLLTSGWGSYCGRSLLQPSSLCAQWGKTSCCHHSSGKGQVDDSQAGATLISVAMQNHDVELTRQQEEPCKAQRRCSNCSTNDSSVTSACRPPGQRKQHNKCSNEGTFSAGTVMPAFGEEALYMQGNIPHCISEDSILALISNVDLQKFYDRLEWTWRSHKIDSCMVVIKKDLVIVNLNSGASNTPCNNFTIIEETEHSFLSGLLCFSPLTVFLWPELKIFLISNAFSYPGGHTQCTTFHPKSQGLEGIEVVRVSIKDEISLARRIKDGMGQWIFDLDYAPTTLLGLLVAFKMNSFPDRLEAWKLKVIPAMYLNISFASSSGYGNLISYMPSLLLKYLAVTEAITGGPIDWTFAALHEIWQAELLWWEIQNLLELEAVMATRSCAYAPMQKHAKLVKVNPQQAVIRDCFLYPTRKYPDVALAKSAFLPSISHVSITKALSSLRGSAQFSWVELNKAFVATNLALEPDSFRHSLQIRVHSELICSHWVGVGGLNPDELGEENLGESEVREAHLAKSLYYIRIGDKEKALEQMKITEGKTVAVGQKMDLVFHTLQLGFFFMDFDLISKGIDKAKNLFEEGGDWERKNRLKVYEGLYCMSTRNFKKAAQLFLDSISTFTTYELFPYDTFIFYTVLTSIISLDRVSLKQKVVDAPEILTVISKIPHLSEFLNSLYGCQYKSFFIAFAGLTDQIKLDRYLHPHFRYYMREVRTVVYSQFLESYKSVTMEAMARAFGVSVDFIDMELSRFIAAGRLHCKIDKVVGVLETNRPDAKNALYQATIKQGDFLLNRIQKLSRVIDL